MPKLDPDPHPAWISSSSSSESNLPQPSSPNRRCWLFSSSKSNNSSSLTKERLDAFTLEKSPYYKSPYYKGLTDSFLVINRQGLARSRPEDEVRTVEVTINQSHSLLDMKEKAIEKEREFIWAEKYRPKALKDFVCHREKAVMLSHMVKFGEQLGHHYIFAGPPGVGKRTMIMAMLRESFGIEKLERKEKIKKFKLEGGMNSSVPISVTLRESDHHIEVNVSKLKDYAPHILIELMTKQHFRSTYRAIVIFKAEKLSKRAQLRIQNLIDIFGKQSKVIFSCSCISKLQPLRSLYTVVHLLPPPSVEIVEILNFIANKEAIELPYQLAQRIAVNSNHNLPQAIRSFEATRQLNYPFKENQVILTGWEEVLAKIAGDMIKEQSPKQLYLIRGKLKLLIKYNICPRFIFTTLVEELKKHFNADIPLFDLYYYGDIVAESSNNGDINQLPKRSPDLESPKWLHDPMRKNGMLFTRIEEFIAKFMSVYKFLDSKTEVNAIL